ncbi:MAG: ECF transporter S component [Erysipelothrix sp.]|nr:ECF transporter S component [Erysipelothrix sp.]
MTNKSYGSKKTQTVVLMALYAALVATVTLFTSVHYSAGGYFNLGDIVVMLLGALVPVQQALVAVSIGSMVADILAGAIHYSVFTGIIKAGMVLCIYMFRKTLTKKTYFIPFILGSLIMLVGYGLVDGFILGGYSFVVSVSLNSVQALVGAVVTTIIYPHTKKLYTYLKG